MTGSESHLGTLADEGGATGTVLPRPHSGTRLSPAARAWLAQALAQATEAAQTLPGAEAVPAARRLSAWELRFGEAGRRCGARHADPVRVLLLRAARPDVAVLTRLYTRGSADERRAVLRALPHLVPGPDALPLIDDALRSHDTRLLAAAVGPYAAAHLDPRTWRHAVLKCLFTGVCVDAVADLARRAHEDGELARMLGDYAQERRAAGRAVPEDLYRVLALISAGVRHARP